jgi:hypothetical protein
MIAGFWDLGKAYVRAVIPIQNADRKPTGISVDDEPMARIREVFSSDLILGDYHSHPNDTAFLSRMKSTTHRAGYGIGSDEFDMLHQNDSFDGMISLVIGVWPGKRKPWRYHWRGFIAQSGKVRRVRISWGKVL